MPGNVKRMIDSIVQQRAKGNPTLIASTRTKLILKGVNPDQFSDTSPDDAVMIGKVRAIGAELGVHV